MTTTKAKQTGNHSQNEKNQDTMSGAQMVIKALIEQGVDTVFGYPGGAVLPIYDELFQQNKI
ncbi:MAG: thiamine pyrophosphate-binding protein, partial [Alphaproteobacteria bacterium]